MVSVDPLVRPRAYFANSDGILGHGSLVFFGYFIGILVLFWVTLEWILARVANAPGGVRGELLKELVSVGFFTLVIMVIVWLLVAAVMHILGGMGTNGSFLDALGLAGWSYAPELIAIPIQGGLIWTEIRDVTFDATTPAAFARDVESFQAGADTTLALVVMLGVIVWSVFILARGIQGTHDAEPAAAWTAAIIVGMGSLFLSLLGMGPA